MIATRARGIIKSDLWAVVLMLNNASTAGAAPITFNCIASVGGALPVCTTTREFEVWFGTLTVTGVFPPK